MSVLFLLFFGCTFGWLISLPLVWKGRSRPAFVACILALMIAAGIFAIVALTPPSGDGWGAIGASLMALYGSGSAAIALLITAALHMLVRQRTRNSEKEIG